MKHTAGSWIANIGNDGRWIVREVRKLGNVIARLWADPQSEANAKLIAAAPDLLKWLKAARATYADILTRSMSEEHRLEWLRALAGMDAAIAKATNTQGGAK